MELSKIQMKYYNSKFYNSKKLVKGVYRIARTRFANMMLDSVRISKDFEDGMNFCHIACGPNLIALDFFPRYNLFGFDISSEGIRNGKILNHPTQSIIADGEHMFPYVDNSFDFVFGNTSMVHVSDWNHYISEMVRITKDGGVIGETFQNMKSKHWYSKVYTELRADGNILSALSKLSPEYIVELYESNGLDNIILSTWKGYWLLFRFLPEKLSMISIGLDRFRVRRKMIYKNDMYFYISGVVRK